MAVYCLDGAGDKKPEHHAKAAKEESWAASPFIDIDNGRESEYDVDTRPS